MSDIRLDIPELDGLLKDLRNAPQSIRTEVDTALKKSAVAIQREAIQEAPVNDGLLRSQIQLLMKPFRAEVQSKAQHSIYVHEGTRPHRAPFEPIRKWSAKKGIPPGAVWMAIARRGTKANPYMKRAAKDSNAIIEKFFNKASANITARLIGDK